MSHFLSRSTYLECRPDGFIAVRDDHQVLLCVVSLATAVTLREIFSVEEFLEVYPADGWTRTLFGEGRTRLDTEPHPEYRDGCGYCPRGNIQALAGNPGSFKEKGAGP